MNSSFLTSICLAGALVLAAPHESKTEDIQSLNTRRSTTASAPWSVLGAWSCTHPDWSGNLNLAADGTMSNADSTGHWTLTASADRIILVLVWDHWPTETLTMVGPDEFRARVRGQGQEGEMVMHRVQPTSDKAVPFETRTWRQGEAPVRLIRKEDGFCALTQVTGSFQGAGEMVRVYVGDDGYWYLGGDSHQEGVAAECIIVRFGNSTKP
jgi:hypothetical protein